MDWQTIRTEIAMRHLVNGHEVRCVILNKCIKYYNSTKYPNSTTVTMNMIKNGKWQVYTWLP